MDTLKAQRSLKAEKGRTIVGIIGGSSFERGLGLKNAREVQVETPYGPTSSPIMTGFYHDVRVAFIARHGKDHGIPPSKVPNLANICALKIFGARAIIGLSAVGSLREEIRPGTLVVPNQLVGWGAHDPRNLSYFNEVGMAVHVSVADPFCEVLRSCLLDAAMPADFPLEEAGKLIVIPGPRFSTRGESELFRLLGCDLVGMTSLEALVAREAQMAYATLALATDYDSWRIGEGVTAAAVTEVMAKNVVSARLLLAAVLPTLAKRIAMLDCPCRHALRDAVMTPENAIPAEMLERLNFLRQ